MDTKLIAYLDRYFAEIIASPEPNKMMFVTPRNAVSDAKNALGRILMDHESAYIEEATETLIDNYIIFKEKGNVTDILGIGKRIFAYEKKKNATLEDEIKASFRYVFGNMSEYDDNENSFANGDGAKAIIAKIDNINDQIKTIAELTETPLEVAKIIKDGLIEKPEIFDFAKHVIGKKFKPVFEGLKKARDVIEEKLVKKAAVTLSNLISGKLLAPGESLVRGRRACEAAELMGFLTETYDTNTTFKNYRAFMLLMQEIYPYEGDNKNISEQTNTLSEIFKKDNLSPSDHLFLEKMYKYQQHRMQIHLNKLVKKEFGLSEKFDDTEIRICKIHAEYAGMRSEIRDVLESDIKLSRTHTNVNSRVIARYLAPLISNNHDPEENYYLLRLAFNDFKDFPGVSLLSITKQLKQILEEDKSLTKRVDEKGKISFIYDFSFIGDIRPNGTLELFAYSSPDTNTPTIRAINNVNSLCNSIVFLTKTAKFSAGYDDTFIGKIDNAENMLDVLKVFYENWKDSEEKLEDIFKSMVPLTSTIHRQLHAFAKNAYYLNDRAEYLVNCFGDFTEDGLLENYEYSRSTSLKLIHLLKEAYSYDVLEIDLLNAIDVASKIHQNPDIKTTEISQLMATVFTDSVKEQLLTFAALRNRPESLKLAVPTVKKEQAKIIRLDDEVIESEIQIEQPISIDLSR